MQALKAYEESCSILKSCRIHLFPKLNPPAWWAPPANIFIIYFQPVTILFTVLCTLAFVYILLKLWNPEISDILKCLPCSKIDQNSPSFVQNLSLLLMHVGIALTFLTSAFYLGFYSTLNYYWVKPQNHLSQNHTPLAVLNYRNLTFILDNLSS